jgi:hypothetical protein
MYLGQRGVPHEERSVQTGEDADAFRALGFRELSFPAVQVGTDALIGFEPVGWNRALDAAGYPKTSRLPLNWQSAPAKPMATATVPGSPTSVKGSEPTRSGGTEPARLEEAASATDRADTASGIAATRTSDTGNREARPAQVSPNEISTIRF